MYFRTRVQIPAPPISSEGLRPSDSPTRALARRFAAPSDRVARSLASLARRVRLRPSDSPTRALARRFAARSDRVARSLASLAR